MLEHYGRLGSTWRRSCTGSRCPRAPLHSTVTQDHGLDAKLDVELVERARPALERGEKVAFALGVRNVDRTVGTILGHHVTKATRGEGLPDDTIEIAFTGTAGQSWRVPAARCHDAPDRRHQRLLRQGARAGGWSSAQRGRLVRGRRTDHRRNVIAYGATSGELFIRGQVGERSASATRC